MSWPAAVPARAAAVAAPTDARPTVGRDRERAALWDGFESAAAGRGLLLCVTGEPGIGKTTLVEDFLAELASERPGPRQRPRALLRAPGRRRGLPADPGGAGQPGAGRGRRGGGPGDAAAGAGLVRPGRPGRPVGDHRRGPCGPAHGRHAGAVEAGAPGLPGGAVAVCGRWWSSSTTCTGPTRPPSTCSPTSGPVAPACGCWCCSPTARPSCCWASTRSSRSSSSSSATASVARCRWASWTAPRWRATWRWPSRGTACRRSSPP